MCFGHSLFKPSFFGGLASDFSFLDIDPNTIISRFVEFHESGVRQKVLKLNFEQIFFIISHFPRQEKNKLTPFLVEYCRLLIKKRS